MCLIWFTDFIMIAMQDSAGRAQQHCFPNLGKSDEERKNKYHLKMWCNNRSNALLRLFSVGAVVGSCSTYSPVYVHAFNPFWAHTIHRPVLGTNEGPTFNKRREGFFFTETWSHSVASGWCYKPLALTPWPLGLQTCATMPSWKWPCIGLHSSDCCNIQMTAVKSRRQLSPGIAGLREERTTHDQ